MKNKWKKVAPMVMGVALAMTTIVTASGSASAVPMTQQSVQAAPAQQEVTWIDLTQAEAQKFEVINGGTSDAKIAGGTIAYPAKLTDQQKKDYKAQLLNPNRTQKKMSTTKSGSSTIEWCTGYYLSNVVYQGNNWYFSSERVGSAEGQGPITLSVSVSRGVSATWSANVGVSADVVSAGVGYSVTGSYSVSSTGTWNVPSGTYGRLEAYPLYDKHTWDVWDDDCGDPTDTYAGSGSSYKPNGGVYFKKVSL